MKKLTLPYLLFFIFLPWVLVSCDSQKKETKASHKEINKAVHSDKKLYFPEHSDYIFNQDTLHTFELRLSKDALAVLDADPMAEKYVEGSLIFEGKTISPVGIRYKGSYGKFAYGLSDNKEGNLGGRKVSTKLSIKIKINWNSNTKFYGLKKLQFHSQNQDPTQMHERLGYWIFREMQVPAPRCVHARLVINGTYVGLYSLVEQIDGQFVKNNFSDSTGNLYKEVWPLKHTGEPYSEKVYLRALKTNEDENPSARLIQTFAQEIAGSNSENIQDVISMWMDVKMIMSYIAVDRSIRVDDGPFRWYCSSNYCTNHNFYWYEDPTESRLYLIPWDLDLAFGNLLSRTRSLDPLADKWGETTANCDPFRHNSGAALQRSAACDKLTAGWVSFKNEYKKSLTELLEGPLSESQVNFLINKWKKQIYAATLEAHKTHPDALSPYRWKNALKDLKVGLAISRQNIAKQIQSQR